MSEKKIIKTNQSWLVPLKVGMRIYHPNFGMATITEIEEDKDNYVNGIVKYRLDEKQKGRRFVSGSRVWYIYQECALESNPFER